MPQRRHARSDLLAQIKRVLIEFLPRPVKEMFEKGLLKAFLIVIFVVVVLPPLVAFLAAFWLKQFGKFDAEVIKGLRNAYLEVIQDGFSFEEFAARSNTRLDYFQWFEADLQPKRKTFKEFRINIQPRQKAAISFKTITVKAESPTCSLPEDEIDLVSIFLGDQLIKTVKQDSNVNFKIDQEWWKENSEADETVQRLSFKLTDQAKLLPECGRVHLEGSISVFKDLLPAARS
jgi:hypothetical protein